MYLKDSAYNFLDTLSLSGNTRFQYYCRLLAVSHSETKFKKPIYEFDKNELYTAFTEASSNPRIWKSIESLLQKYFIWAELTGEDVSIGNKSISELDSSRLKDKQTKQYFYSTSQLLAKLDNDTKYVAKVERRQQTDYRMISSAVILLWIGLRIEEVPNIKKADILSEPNVVYYKQNKIDINPRLYAILKECANAKFYTQININNTFSCEYAESEYLFRTQDRNYMDVKTLRSAISYFNSSLYAKAMPYRAEKIYWSGVFYRAHQIEVEIGGFDDTIDDKAAFYGALFREQYKTQAQMTRRIREYKLYTSFYSK